MSKMAQSTHPKAQPERKFMYAYEVQEEEWDNLIPLDIKIISQEGRRLWVRQLVNGSYAILDSRIRRQRLPRNSIPLCLYNGPIVAGEAFNSFEIEAYRKVYGLLTDCIFEQSAINCPAEEHSIWHVRLYLVRYPGRQPMLYPYQMRNGKLVIPVVGGGEIEVTEGEEFIAEPFAASESFSGVWPHRAAVQYGSAWIDFDRLVGSSVHDLPLKKP
jgi:hypothetical protein